MKVPAMLLAAGRGERMRPLTDSTPKPLLVVHGKPLMRWAMEALARGACARVVVNTAWLGDQIAEHFGPTLHADGATLALDYSHEGRDFGAALETAGGITRALPLLCPATAAAPQSRVFWVLAGDVYAPDFSFAAAAVQRFVESGKLAHLWLVPNPAHNPRGDFGLTSDGSGLALSLAPEDARPRWTYSTIGLYRAPLFAPPWCSIAPGNPQGAKAALAPLLRAAMASGQVSAEIYRGRWTDVGTPERLEQINAEPY